MKFYPFLSANLETLKKENPSAYQWIHSQGPGIQASGDSIFLNRKGVPDWRLPSGEGLFQAISPRSAYRSWVPPDPSRMGVTLIIGCNMGHGLNHLLPKIPPGHQVLVLEPRPEMLLACLGRTDYRPFLHTRKLIFIPPVKAHLLRVISQMILPCIFGKIVMRSDIPSLQLGPEYAIWAGQCREALEDLRLRVTTMRRSQDEMMAHELHNFERAGREGSLMGLRGKGQGVSAIILGAGPSLEQFAGDLARNRRRALYATSLQALPTLRKYGLKPHFCMAIDYSQTLIKVYQGLDMDWAKEIPLIYSTTVSPEVVERYPGPTIPLWTQGGLASHTMAKRELVLDVGGNVGVALVRFLMWSGVRQLLLVGQDFSWPAGKTHAQGHLATENQFEFDPKTHITFRNRLGEIIYSAQPYLNGLRELERDLEQAKIPVFDLYGGGLVIKGSTPVGWDEVSSKGLLESSEKGLERFLETLTSGLMPVTWDAPQSRIRSWTAFLESARGSLEALFRTPTPDQKHIHGILERVLHYLQQDPLCRPYLLNETINMAGVMAMRDVYGPKELAGCREVMNRVLSKIREVDHHLVREPQTNQTRPGCRAAGEMGSGPL